MGYNYVLTNELGQVTWGTSESKKTFDKFYQGKMHDGSGRNVSDVYTIIEEGITKQRALEITEPYTIPNFITHANRDLERYKKAAIRSVTN